MSNQWIVAIVVLYNFVLVKGTEKEKLKGV